MSPEWVETVDDDERFLPLIQEEASQICPYLWLGSEENARDLVWLKVNRITRVVTIMPRAIYPIECGQMSEALKAWFAENVETLFLKALDTPTELVFDHVREAVGFINTNIEKKEAVIVHCGRGISRSATLVIAVLMAREKISYTDAFALASSKRPCIYPNVGFQIQLCLYEKLGMCLGAVLISALASYDMPFLTSTRIIENCKQAQVDKIIGGKDFDIASEIAMSIRKTLENVEEQTSNMFKDDSIKDDPQRWMDFGFFIQNCREYLGHIDIGLPWELLDKAEDVARRLQNLGMIFQGRGVVIAVRVGKVLAVWHSLQLQLSSNSNSLPRIDADYVSCLDRPDLLPPEQASCTKRKRETFD